MKKIKNWLSKKKSDRLKKRAISLLESDDSVTLYTRFEFVKDVKNRKIKSKYKIEIQNRKREKIKVAN